MKRVRPTQLWTLVGASCAAVGVPLLATAASNDSATDFQITALGAAERLRLVLVPSPAPFAASSWAPTSPTWSGVLANWGVPGFQLPAGARERTDGAERAKDQREADFQCKGPTGEVEASTRDSSASGAAVPAQLSGGASHTRQLAREYRDELEGMRRQLRERGLQLPPDRFDDANCELMRYAGTFGLHRAHTAAGRTKSCHEAVIRIQQTLEFLEHHKFMEQAELKELEHMVRWAGHDAAGHPVLVVRLGQALRESDPHALEKAAEAVVSQTEVAVRSMLSNEEGRIDQMVVLMSCTGTSSLQVPRLVSLVRHIAMQLNRHYPARLAQLFVVDAPYAITVPLKAGKKLLHPETANKILLCADDDERLPFRSDG